MNQIVLDAGFLIAIERRSQQAYLVAEELYGAHLVAHIPAGVLAQVWRGSPKQQVIARLVKSRAVRIHALTEDIARRVGVLLANSGTRDVIDGHVALLAADLSARVFTSDPDDIAKLNPDLTLITI